MPAKSRSNPQPRAKEKNYTTAESFKYADEKYGDQEVCAGAMIKSRALVGFGHESQASLSRMNPDGLSGPVGRNETSDYFHIHNAPNPFFSDTCGISAGETIELTQKAFYSFPSFRNPILMQSYLCNSPIHFTCKNKKILKFYKEWAKKCGLWALANEFFLEWFRSGNVFVYKFLGELKLSDVKQIGKASEAIARNRTLPLKYVLVDPREVRGLGTSIFTDQVYGKTLNPYEADMLKRGKTDQDKAIFNGLSPEAKEAIKKGQVPLVNLDPSRLRVAFNGKQSYEPMAVPPYFGVLKSINFKQILRSAEEKVAASADYCILFITAGEKEKKESDNKKLIEAMANLFSAQDVGRVLFAHHSAKAQFVIPELNEIFGNEKYVNVDKDIINGMNDIMASDENFATGQTKTKVYLELLHQARESFLQYFLLPEMEQIAKDLGFSEVPEVTFEEVTLESLNEAKKLYNRLYEIGALTPAELFYAYESNQLPTPEASAESQKEFKAQRKAGLYEPILGGKADPAGRPNGTKAPKSKNTISPKGQASLGGIKSIYPKMSDLSEKVQSLYKDQNSIARLSKKNKEFTNKIWENIIISAPVNEWEESAAKVVADPMALDFASTEQYAEIEEISEEFQIGMLEAAILYHSRDSEEK
jgi:hypothetical protein